MDLSIEHLTQAALLLPIEERAALAARFVQSIENEQPAVSDSWLDAAERRRKEILAGTAKSLSADEVSAHEKREPEYWNKRTS